MLMQSALLLLVGALNVHGYVSSNKCQTTKIVEQQRMRTVFRDVIETYQTRCSWNSFRYNKPCTKTRTVQRPQIEYYTERVPQVVEKCCAGYVDDGSGDCRPDCGGKCEHGRCMEPGQCDCDSGYQLDDGGLCQPHCANGCTDGHCSAPDVCDCPTDFRLDANIGTCLAVCEPACEHGTCVAPNRCDCQSGYRAVINNFCEPICTDCPPNSDCVAPEQCQCHVGYTNETSRHDGITHECWPVCSSACPADARCVRPDGGCECAPDFELVTTADGLECQPYCAPGLCAPGQLCVAPGKCELTDTTTEEQWVTTTPASKLDDETTVPESSSVGDSSDSTEMDAHASTPPFSPEPASATTDTIDAVPSSTDIGAANDPRMPCIPLCRRNTTRQLDGDALCIECRSPAECTLYGGVAGGGNASPIAPHEARELAARRPEMCQCHSDSKADSRSTVAGATPPETGVDGADDSAAVALSDCTEGVTLGVQVSCTISGCLSAATAECEATSGVCRCREGFELVAGGYRCAAARGSGERAMADATAEGGHHQTMWIVVGSLLLVLVAVAALVAHVMHTKKASYIPREMFVVESSSM